jgi:hypothetical protein
MKMSWMSRRRARRPSIRYSLSPERKRRRVMVISPVGMPVRSSIQVTMLQVQTWIHQRHGDGSHA